MMLTAKQERFTVGLFEGKTHYKAWEDAGYSTRYNRKDIDSHACRLAALPKIKARLAELRNIAAAASISTVVERKQILTEIQRAKIGDFVDEQGNLNLNKRLLKNAAVAEIRIEQTATGARSTLKLRDPIDAISEHNKMDGVYSVEARNTVNNVQINVITRDAAARELVSKILSGTRLSPAPLAIKGE